MYPKPAPTCHNGVLGSLYKAAIGIVDLTERTQTDVQIFQSLAQRRVVLEERCCCLSSNSSKGPIM